MSVLRTLRMTTLGVLSATLVACSADAPSAPQGAAEPIGEASFAKGGNLNRHDGVYYTTISIQPDSTKVYKLTEEAWVYIPAHATCVQSTPYGTGEWDNACERATTPVGVDVVVTIRNGVPSANFYPDLRFAPAADSDYMNWVYLGLKTKGKPTTDLEKYAILYRPTGSSALVDESISDATLRAFRYSGFVVRRLKHFSGYNVSLGMYEEQTSDPFGTVLEPVQ